MFWLGIKPGSPHYKTNALTTDPRSRLSDAVVRNWLYTRIYGESTLCRYIGESDCPVTLPLFKEVIIYDDGKPFLGKRISNPGRAPILRHDSHNKVKHSRKYSCALEGNQTRVAPVQNQCSNHWARESTLTQLSEIEYILEAMRNLPSL